MQAKVRASHAARGKAAYNRLRIGNRRTPGSMKKEAIKKSPVFASSKRWEAKPDAKLYESELTAMVRKMLEDPEIRDDQEWAWRRWRSGDNAIRRD